MAEKDKTYYLEEELLLIENSGEIPEVAYHGSLYFLREDPDGPALNLSDEDLAPSQTGGICPLLFASSCATSIRPCEKKGFIAVSRAVLPTGQDSANSVNAADLDLAEPRKKTGKPFAAFCNGRSTKLKTAPNPPSTAAPKTLPPFPPNSASGRRQLPDGWQQHCL